VFDQAVRFGRLELRRPGRHGLSCFEAGGAGMHVQSQASPSHGRPGKGGDWLRPHDSVGLSMTSTATMTSTMACGEPWLPRAEDRHLLPVQRSGPAHGGTFAERAGVRPGCRTSALAVAILASWRER
jgi:hypothetical protein